MVEGLHALVNPLAAMLPRLIEPSPYSSCGSTWRTLRQSRSIVSTLTRLVPPARQAACTDRTSPMSAFDPAELLQVLDALLGGAGLQGMQQR